VTVPDGHLGVLLRESSLSLTRGEVNKLGDFKFLSQLAMVLSGLAVILAGVGSIGADIWLASTQWLLVAVVLAEFGIYLRLEE